MSLIAILFALFIEHFLGSLEELRRFDWFAVFTAWLRGRLPAGPLWDGPLGVLLVIGLPTALVALLGHLLAGVWWVIGFFYAVFVLLYAFGPRDLEAEVEAYTDAQERGDEQSARWYAANLLGGEVPESPRLRAHAIIETILIQAHERLLGIVFWFVLLGPMGAILYRLSRELDAQAATDSGFGLAAWRLHQILAWLPSQLCAFSYALAGSFTDAMKWRREAAMHWLDEARGVLVTSGFGALRYRPAEETGGDDDPHIATENVLETLGMVRRAVIVWLSVLAVFTLAGWHG